MLIRLADYIMRTLADRGVRHIFMITGGGAMHLNDAVAKETRLSYICNHHEQACAIAAEGYARTTGEIGVLNVTTGPGGINALNGVFGAWTDSIPMLVISGQVKRETCLGPCGLEQLRQLGDQEADVISMAKGVTKYAVLVDDPMSIRYHLEKALFLARSGRPGPCWLDIPLDVQSSRIEEDDLKGYDPAEDAPAWDKEAARAAVSETLRRIASAERPCIMAGTGVRLAGAVDRFEKVIHRLGIPVTTAWTAPDLLASDDPVYCGRPSTIGDRGGNFTVQNSDLVLVLGSRLNIRQVSYNWKSFARCAFKIQVDVDKEELTKPTVRPDLPIQCDLAFFLEEMDRQLDAQTDQGPAKFAGWLAWCRERVAKYPVVQPKQRQFNGFINPYHFLDTLLRRLDGDDVVVCGNGTVSVIPFQLGHMKKGMRMFANSGCASMGYDLPAAIGAAVARGGKRVICLAGDGSLQMNIQELQTLAHHRWPIKLFVINNDGYISIRQTQRNFFGRMIGERAESGVSFPDMVALAKAYGLPAQRIDMEDFGPAIDAALSSDGPMVCDVRVDPEQGFEPKLASKQLPNGRMVSPPLEDMFPFLDRDELLGNLLVPPMEY